MMIEFLGYRNGTEKLLYSVITNDLSYDVVWPSPALYYTNNFDAGSEAIRISDIPLQSWLFDGDLFEGILLGINTGFSGNVVLYPGKKDFTLNRVVNLAYTNLGNAQSDIIGRLDWIAAQIFNQGV